MKPSSVERRALFVVLVLSAYCFHRRGCPYTPARLQRFWYAACKYDVTLSVLRAWGRFIRMGCLASPPNTGIPRLETMVITGIYMARKSPWQQLNGAFPR
jgi:hypothetical protein